MISLWSIQTHTDVVDGLIELRLIWPGVFKAVGHKISSGTSGEMLAWLWWHFKVYFLVFLVLVTYFIQPRDSLTVRYAFLFLYMIQISLHTYIVCQSESPCPHHPLSLILCHPLQMFEVPHDLIKSMTVTLPRAGQPVKEFVPCLLILDFYTFVVFCSTAGHWNVAVK